MCWAAPAHAVQLQSTRAASLLPSPYVRRTRAAQHQVSPADNHHRSSSDHVLAETLKSTGQKNTIAIDEGVPSLSAGQIQTWTRSWAKGDADDTDAKVSL